MIPAVFWIATLLAVAAPAKAPPAERHPPMGDCRDDDMVDRCSPEQQRRVRELFGVKPIEAHRAAGDQVRRAFYVDGYGNDVVAIAFVRPKGGDPTLWIHFPHAAKGARPEALQAPVPGEVWEDVLRRSSHFDRRLVRPPQPPSASGEMTLCMHSWVFTVEATDPAEGDYQPATVRRATEDACDDGLAEAYAVELQRAALPLLPPCAALDRSRYRNEAMMISACRLLSGDRLAAAKVLNRADPLRFVREAEDTAELEGLFQYQATVDWNGERSGGNSTAAKFWTAKVLENGRADLYYETIEGLAPGRVRLTGRLFREITAPGSHEPVDEQARVEQIWTDDQGDFAIRSATVGPFQRQPPP